MLMEWSDLEAGDKVKFSNNFCIDVKQNPYGYYRSEIDDTICKGKVWLITRVVIKTLGNIYISLYDSLFEVVINKYGLDAGLGSGCPSVVFDICELRG